MTPELQKPVDLVKELRLMRQPHWSENFRALTPIGLFIAAFFLNSFAGDIKRLDKDIGDMRGEVSHHLQNSEIHIPRATVVSKDEFMLYQTIRDRQMADLKDSLNRIECSLNPQKNGK